MTVTYTVTDKTAQEFAAYIIAKGQEAILAVKEELRQALIDAEYTATLATIAELDDEAALDVGYQFPPFNPDGHAYTTDERFYYPINGKLYKVLQNHTSQADWLPDTAVSLYVEVSPPGVIPLWVQPVGAQDAYNTGDKVQWPEGTVWTSTVDANVWEPGVYGWVQD